MQLKTKKQLVCTSNLGYRLTGKLNGAAHQKKALHVANIVVKELGAGAILKGTNLLNCVKWCRFEFPEVDARKKPKNVFVADIAIQHLLANKVICWAEGRLPRNTESGQLVLVA